MLSKLSDGADIIRSNNMALGMVAQRLNQRQVIRHGQSIGGESAAGVLQNALGHGCGKFTEHWDPEFYRAPAAIERVAQEGSPCILINDARAAATAQG